MRFEWFFPFFKKFRFWSILGPTKHGGNHSSQWIRDLWSNGVSQINFSIFLGVFLSFCVLDEFFRFSKCLVFGYYWSTLLWYRCYSPHWLRDALSPVCGIFSFNFFEFLVFVSIKFFLVLSQFRFFFSFVAFLSFWLLLQFYVLGFGHYLIFFTTNCFKTKIFFW